MIWPGCHLPFCQSRPGPHISVWRFLFQWSKLCETCPRNRQISRPIDISIIIDAFLLLDIQIRMRSSGDVNVFQWNREWFFSRRVKLDSGFNGMAVFDVSWHGPKVVHRFTGIRKWVILQESQFYSLLELVEAVLSGCVQVLISSKEFDSSIFDWKINYPFSLGNIISFALSLFE